VGGLTRSFAEMTEQLRQARAQLQGSLLQLETGRTRLQTILDSLSAGVIVFDSKRRIDTVNPGATRILRLPISVYRGHELDEVPGLFDFAEAIWNRFELHADSPETGERDHWQDSFELKLAGTDQDTLTLLVRGAPLPLGQWLMVFDDISEVISAQRSAAWSEVARRLAHEIKNPLTPIQLSAERLQHKLESKLHGADQLLLARAVSTIVAQVQGMQRLVNDFRDYARLPSVHLAPLDLNALVSEVSALYGAMVDQGRLKLVLAPALPMILGDASQLRQVIHNLTQNALDAVEPLTDGRVTLVTEAARKENGQVRAVRLKVMDNGPGFADKVMKRAFEPYVTTKAKGTGLGLAVVHGVMRTHEGAVDVQSTPGQGSRFTLYFPVASGQAPAPPSAAPSAAPAAAAPPPATEPPGGAPGKKHHVMYVDDDQALVFLVQRLLRRRGYEVSGFTDPHEATAALRTAPQRYDLLVTDYNMPGFCGVDLVREARLIRPGLPVALASGYVTAEIEQAALAEGAQALIHKPNDVEELCATVERLVGGDNHAAS